MTERYEQLVRQADPLPGLGTTPSPVEVAWAAGIIEGEGNFHGSTTIRDGKPWPHRSLRVQVSMIDVDILQRLQGILGGTINGPYLRGTSRKPIWYWSLSRRAHMDQAVCLIYPWLGARWQYQCRNAYLRVGRRLPFEGGD